MWNNMLEAFQVILEHLLPSHLHSSSSSLCSFSRLWSCKVATEMESSPELTRKPCLPAVWGTHPAAFYLVLLPLPLPLLFTAIMPGVAVVWNCVSLRLLDLDLRFWIPEAEKSRFRGNLAWIGHYGRHINVLKYSPPTCLVNVWS